MIEIILAVTVVFMILFIHIFINKLHRCAQKVERLHYNGRWKYILYTYYIVLVLITGSLIILNL